MGRTIDERVVEMRFDNKQFEAGTKQTLGTLAKLKEALKLPDSVNALDGIDKAARRISLDGLASAIDTINERFSTLGIVGMRVIENITDGLINKVHAAVNYVTDAITSGGVKRAMNIENAHFQLQALLKDEEKVQAVMADAMESVDGTAYAYDEAAKAASQFAASGVEAGDEMLNALKGITGVAAMTNSEFEGVSQIFTTVAGNGRLMGDQLLQLSSRGLNAAATIANYFREVRGEAEMTESQIRDLVSDGEISFKDFSDAMTWAFGDSAKRANETFTGAMANMRSALARIGADFVSPLVEQNSELVGLFNALRIKINDVRTAIKFDEQRSAISGLAEVTGLTKDELSEMFSTIKENGEVSAKNLDVFTKKGANAYVALVRYMNGVTEGTVRANYATTNAIKDLTNGTRVSTADIERFVKSGKINLAMFTSAMETEFGNEKTIVKQFTDWFLDHVSLLVDAVNSADMTTPMENFYYWFESGKNVVKGLLSVLKPLGKALGDVFLVFDVDDITSASEAIENLTSRLKLSEEQSKDLYDAAKGLFDLAKLGIDIGVELFKAIIPINKPIGEIGKGVLGLAGYIGKLSSKFSDLIRSSSTVKKWLKTISSGFSSAAEYISKFIEFVMDLSKTKGAEKLIQAIGNAFTSTFEDASSYFEKFMSWIGSFIDAIFDLDEADAETVLNDISDAFESLADVINRFSLKGIINSFDEFIKKAKEVVNFSGAPKNITDFLENGKDYAEDLKGAFTFDDLLKNIEKFMSVFGNFFNWIKDNFSSAFEDFSVGGAVAASGGMGLIYSIMRFSEAFASITKTISGSNPLKSITGVLGSIKGVLDAYQKDIKADSLIKAAKAIAILSASLILLSFVDSDKVTNAALSLSLVAGILMFGVTKLLEACNKGSDINNTISTFAKGLNKALNKLGRAVEIKAVGEAISNFAKSVGIIALSIIGLGILWKKDKEAFNAASNAIADIFGILTLLGGLMVLGSKIANNEGVEAIGKSILMVTASLALIVFSINKLFKMELPSDYGIKLGILAGIFVGLIGLTIVMAKAAKTANGKKAPDITKTIKSLAVLMFSTVLSLKMLFEMELPSDYGIKIGILAGIFVGLTGLVLVMAQAAKVSKGKGFSAASTILAMAGFIVAVTGSLFILSIIPVKKLLTGAVGLGLVLVALKKALEGAGNVKDKGVYKTVLAMAVMVGAIATSLAILSMIRWEKLLISAASLGGVLLALAAAFDGVSKVKSEKALPSIIAMIAATLTIAGSLAVLAAQPWEGMLASGAAMSATILSFSKSFEMILGKRWSENNVKKIGTFLLMTLAVIPIGVALYALSTQPWDNMLAAAVSLSGTLLALAGCFAIVSGVKVNLTAIGAVVAGSAALLLVAAGIALLAQYDGQQLLASCLALSGTLVVLIGIMAACAALSAVAPAAMAGVVEFGIVIAELTVLLAAIGAIAQIPGLKWIVEEGGDFLQAIGTAIGQFIGGLAGGIMAGVAAQLPQIGEDLSDFMDNLQPFLEGAKNIDADAAARIGFLSAMIIALTAAEVVNGVANLFQMSLVDMAVELSDFMTELGPFLENSKSITPESMQACKALAGMLIILTGAELISGINRILGINGGSFEEFGNELVKFGPKIKKFSDSVIGIDAEAVKGAAAAGEIMATLSRKLPSTGGFVQKVFGTKKNLSDFGKELVIFGPSLTLFATSVKGITEDSVSGAAAAAEIMSALANKLPLTGGFVQKVFGTKKNLSDFGKELVIFGPFLTLFANSVKGITEDSVSGAAAAAEIMATLASGLPSTETLWQKIFGGGQMSLSQFGAELVKFGLLMTEFSDSIGELSTEKITALSNSFKQMVDLANYVEESSGKTLVDFAKQISEIGVESVDKFAEAFTNGGEKAAPAIATFMTVVENNIKAHNETFMTLGASSVDYLISGIKSKYIEASLTGIILINTVLASIKKIVPTFMEQGISSGTLYLFGIKSKYPEATSVGQTLANNVLSGCRGVSGFYSAGANAGAGFVNGISSNLGAASAAGRALAEAAYNAAKRALDEHSPSKKMAEVGDFAGLGFIESILAHVINAKKAGEDLGNAAVKGTISVMSNFGGFDVNPVIRPNVDLENVKKSVSDINRMFNNSISYTAGLARSTSSSLSNGNQATNIQNTSKIPTDQKIGNSYNFIQNNYSPKALSRIEIYRQTKNQFTQFKGATDKS